MEEAAEKRGVTSFRPIDEVGIKEGIWGEGNERSRCARHFKRRISTMEAEGLWVKTEGSNQGWDQEDYLNGKAWRPCNEHPTTGPARLKPRRKVKASETLRLSCHELWEKELGEKEY